VCTIGEVHRVHAVDADQHNVLDLAIALGISARGYERSRKSKNFETIVHLDPPGKKCGRSGSDRLLLCAGNRSEFEREPESANTVSAPSGEVQAGYCGATMFRPLRQRPDALRKQRRPSREAMA
jgi:hypothetical protein